jgi:outer membrane protein assembly factor BamE (lipoprotein component of BamABCDE complex)
MRHSTFISTVKRLTVVALLLLSACAVDPGVRPFWELNQSDFGQLKPGMTKAGVEVLLGKPILVSTFSRLGEDVWDYRYMDIQMHMYATLHFDSQGALKYHTERLDPAYISGGPDR